MNTQTRMALGLAGGYVLGKFHKTRWLVFAAAAVAAKRYGGELAQRGSQAVSSTPELQQLADQGRQVAASVLGHRIEGLTERIHARTESLRETLEQPDGQQSDGQQPDGQQPEGERSEGQTPEGEQSEDQPREEASTAESESQLEPAPARSGGQQWRAHPNERTDVAGRPSSPWIRR